MKKILVVDDHFEILEFLRSMLQASSRDYDVLGVPSAEEGLYELRRTPYDLLISDVRLPGMSGFELVRRVRALQPEMPIIMITAYTSVQGQEEAEALGVYRYFTKPLDTDTLLATVHSALYGKPAPAPKKAPVQPAPRPPQAKPTVDQAVRARLQSLRTDTGAAQVGLADARGNVLFTSGSANTLDFARLAQIMAKTLENSLLLAAELQSEEPLMIQYQSGERVDLYSANVGRAYFVMLFFEAHARRGRIGTIWIFAQRAVKDLRQLLLSAGEGGEAAAPPATGPTPATPPPSPGKRERTSPTMPAWAQARPQPAETARAETPAESRAEAAESAVEDTAVEGALPDLESSELAALLAEGEVGEAEVDLDAFWEEIVTGEDEGGVGSGLSLEEAREQGLIPPDFGDLDG